MAARGFQTGLVRPHQFAVPTTEGEVHGVVFENLRIGRAGPVEVIRKPREAAFGSFADYKVRLTGAAASLLSNAVGYEPVVSLSGGYDSTAVAAVAAPLGCGRAVALRHGRMFPGGLPVPDFGHAAAQALGLELEVFERTAYRDRADNPEAEFLATGMSAEDVPFAAYERAINRSVLLTGFWAGQLWVKSRLYPPRDLHPGDLSGCDITEFSLRADFIHVPLPNFGAPQSTGSRHFFDDEDMQPFTLGGHYDRPIPRRIAEEGGVQRGAFASGKRGASVMIQRDPGQWFSPATLEAIQEYARTEGVSAMPRRRSATPRIHRGLIQLANRLRVPRLVDRLEKRRISLVHFEPDFGSVALRWAVSHVGPRYRGVEDA